MPEKFITLPNGEELTFPIDTPDSEIYDTLRQRNLEKIRAFKKAAGVDQPKEIEQAGLTGAFVENLFDFGEVDEAAEYLSDKDSQTRRALIRETTPEYKYQAFEDVDSFGKAYQLGKEVLGGSVGAQVAPITAGVGAAGLTALIPVVGPAAAPFTGALAYIGTSALQYLPEYTRRQALLSEKSVQEGKRAVDPNPTKLIGGALASGAIDRLTLAAFPAISKLFGLSGKDAAEEVAAGLVREYQSKGMGASLQRLFGGTSVPMAALRGGAIEGGQEIVQNLVARYSAGEELTSDDAYKEYLASGVIGTFLGTALGGTDAGVRKLRVRSKTNENLREQQRQKNIKLSERRRTNNQSEIDQSYESDAAIDDFELTRENLVERGIDEQASTLRIVDKERNPEQVGAMAFEIDNITDDQGNVKSTKDIKETGALFQNLLSSFRDKERQLTKVTEKDQTPEADSNLVTQANKMMPTLKQLSKIILDYTKANKIKTKKVKKDEEATVLEYTPEDGDTNTTRKEQINSNFDKAFEAAALIGQKADKDANKGDTNTENKTGENNPETIAQNQDSNETAQKGKDFEFLESVIYDEELNAANATDDVRNAVTTFLKDFFSSTVSRTKTRNADLKKPNPRIENSPLLPQMDDVTNALRAVDDALEGNVEGQVVARNIIEDVLSKQGITLSASKSKKTLDKTKATYSAKNTLENVERANAIRERQQNSAKNREAFRDFNQRLPNLLNLVDDDTGTFIQNMHNQLRNEIDNVENNLDAEKIKGVLDKLESLAEISKISQTMEANAPDTQALRDKHTSFKQSIMEEFSAAKENIAPDAATIAVETEVLKEKAGEYLAKQNDKNTKKLNEEGC